MTELSKFARLVLENKHNGRKASQGVTTRGEWRLLHFALIELESEGLITDDHPQVVLTPAGKLRAIELFGRVDNAKI